MCFKLCCHLFVTLWSFFKKHVWGVGWVERREGVITSSHLVKIIYHFMPLGEKKVLVRVCELVTCETATVEMKGRKDESSLGVFFCIRFHAPGTLLGDILLYHDVHLLVCLCLPVGFIFVDFSLRGCVKSLSLSPADAYSRLYARMYLCIMNCVKCIYSLLCKHVVLDPWIM